MLARLNEAGVDYFIANSASGVTGLRSALPAGLGFSCLNASEIPNDVVPLTRTRTLPRLPHVEFNLLIPDVANQPLAREIAKLLVVQTA